MPSAWARARCTPGQAGDLVKAWALQRRGARLGAAICQQRARPAVRRGRPGAAGRPGRLGLWPRPYVGDLGTIALLGRRRCWPSCSSPPRPAARYLRCAASVGFGVGSRAGGGGSGKHGPGTPRGGDPALDAAPCRWPWSPAGPSPASRSAPSASGCWRWRSGWRSTRRRWAGMVGLTTVAALVPVSVSGVGTRDAMMVALMAHLGQPRRAGAVAALDADPAAEPGQRGASATRSGGWRAAAGRGPCPARPAMNEPLRRQRRAGRARHAAAGRRRGGHCRSGAPATLAGSGVPVGGCMPDDRGTRAGPGVGGAARAALPPAVCRSPAAGCRDVCALYAPQCSWRSRNWPQARSRARHPDSRLPWLDWSAATICIALGDRSGPDWVSSRQPGRDLLSRARCGSARATQYCYQVGCEPGRARPGAGCSGTMRRCASCMQLLQALPPRGQLIRRRRCTASAAPPARPTPGCLLRRAPTAHR